MCSHSASHLLCRTLKEVLGEQVRQKGSLVEPKRPICLLGEIHLFGEKYEEKVHVVTMAHSKERCGGTHCRETGQVGLYMTTQETRIEAGIHRIKALTGRAAEVYLSRKKQIVNSLAAKLQINPDTNPNLLETRVE